MWKWLLTVFGAIIVAPNAFASFAMIQTGFTPVAAASRCNVITGVATGMDAGTCLVTPAVCNGVADDRSMFIAANTWARASTANAASLIVEIYIPPGYSCLIASGNVQDNHILSGIRKGRLTAYGSELNSNGVTSFMLGPTSTLGGVCQAAIWRPNGCSARTNTAVAGSSSVILSPSTSSGMSLATLCARFTAGNWAIMAGFDLQGTYASAYGKPPNSHYFEFVQITSTANCLSTGEVAFTPPLQDTYLSTWPLYADGSFLEVDQGGPATLYALGLDITAISQDSWGYESEVYGLTTNASLGAIGRSFFARDVTMTGAQCISPSQVYSFSLVNSFGLNCLIEVDKWIKNYVIDNTPHRRIFFQSSSTTNFVVRNTVFPNVSPTANIDGTPRRAMISNSTIPNIKLGPVQNLGRAESFLCTDCVFGNVLSMPGGVFKGGPGDPGTQIYFAPPNISGGVFSSPDFMNVLGWANNGSGKVRLTVANTSGWATGVYKGQQGLYASCSPCSGSVLTVVDSTHFDTTIDFASATWSGAGMLVSDSWNSNIPGSYFSPSGSTSAASQFIRITGVTQDSAGTHMATTYGGSTYPPYSGTTSFMTTIIPDFTCTRCTGTAQAVDMSGWPPNIPQFGRSARSYTNLTPMETTTLLGKVTSITINVTQAYTGATSPMRFLLFMNTNKPDGTLVNYGPLINLRQAGTRVITPAGVTCDTGGGPVAGACSGDSGFTLPDPDAMISNTMTPSRFDASPTDQPWAMNYSFILDTGIP